MNTKVFDWNILGVIFAKQFKIYYLFPEAIYGIKVVIIIDI